MSTMTPKVVMFTIDLGAPPVELNDKDENEEHSKLGSKYLTLLLYKNNIILLESMISELNTAMTGVKHEQDYMEVRERIHRAINENTNRSVTFINALP